MDSDDIKSETEGPSVSKAPSPSNESEEDLDIFDVDEESCSEDSDKDDKPRRSQKITSKLSPHLKGLMGEANLRYARGDIETSRKMCYEVIRQARDAYEPYLTLSQMCETTNVEQFKEYLTIASHLAAGNIDIMCRLAEVYLQEGNICQAIKTYSKAISKDPKNMELHRKRIELLQTRGNIKLLLTAKQSMAKNAPKRDHETIIKLAMGVAKEYFNQKNYTRAVEALKIPLKRIPSKVTKDVINMILELLILLERYSECLDVLTQFCGFSFDVMITENTDLYINSFVQPESLHVDLKFKFYICLVKLRAEHLFTSLIDNILLEDDVETVGDLHLDLIEALMVMGYHSVALKLLIVLVKSKSFSSAAVWLRYAECLKACSLPDQAIEAYFTVLSMAPTHVEVLHPLAKLLLQQNRRKEALEVLSQDLSSNKVDVAILLEQMKLLMQLGDWENYWKSAELLLSRHCIVLKYPEDLKIAMTTQTLKEKTVAIKKMRSVRNESQDIEPDVVSVRGPSVEEEYEILKEILQLAFDRKEYALFQKFTFMAMCSKRLIKYFSEIFLLALYASIFNGDSFHSYIMIRDLLFKHTKNNVCWNWFNLITATPDEIRHLRFLDRSKIDCPPEERTLTIANNALNSGNYEGSMGCYIKHFKETESSYSCFMLGVAMLQNYFQRKVDVSKKKILAETITYLFLNYSKCRSKNVEQEIYYNLGRMYHQLGVTYLAEHYYKRVLNVRNDYLDKYPNLLCLKREAAFNLHLIYKHSGNFTAAREILYEHIVI